MRRRSVGKGWIALCLMLQVAMLACNRPRVVPDPISIEPAYLNQQVRVNAPSYFNSFKTMDWVTLEVTFRGDAPMRFENYYGVRIFELSPSGWREIGELPTEHYPQTAKVFSPETGPYRDVMAVFPNLPDGQGVRRLRIYITGELHDAAQTHSVGAYTDIDLHP